MSFVGSPSRMAIAAKTAVSNMIELYQKYVQGVF